MPYIVKIPFVTLVRSYSTGEVLADVEDAKNLVAAGIVENVSVETEAPAAAEEAETSLPTPTPKKRGKK